MNVNSGLYLFSQLVNCHADFPGEKFIVSRIKNQLFDKFIFGNPEHQVVAPSTVTKKHEIKLVL